LGTQPYLKDTTSTAAVGIETVVVLGIVVVVVVSAVVSMKAVLKLVTVVPGCNALEKVQYSGTHEAEPTVVVS
jgi:hypothetical protein